MNEQGKHLSALGGHLVDLWHLVRMEFVNPHSLTKFRCINRLRRRTNARVFVETGTYLGNTAYRASWVFDRVITIELDEELANRAARYLAARPNVTVIQGDAVEALPRVFDDPAVRDALVFLDGHFSGSGTACGSSPEPALGELAALSHFHDRVAAVQIDDFRLFGSGPGFPSKSDLVRAAERAFGPEFDLDVNLDQLMLVRRAAVR